MYRSPRPADIIVQVEVIPNSQVEQGGRVMERKTKTVEEGMHSVRGDGHYAEKGRRDARISRRRFLQLGAGAAAGTLLLPGLPEAAGAATLVDPYSGSIPLVFPLLYGTYKSPVQDNWHANREGQTYTWNHRNSTSQRAHDGVDVFPSRPRKLPRVYAPLTGTVAAVCTRSSNTVGAAVTYRVSSDGDTPPPPWDYSKAIDTEINRPLYGNFVWLHSTDAASAGYFVFFCHLKNETTIQSLDPGDP